MNGRTHEKLIGKGFLPLMLLYMKALNESVKISPRLGKFGYRYGAQLRPHGYKDVLVHVGTHGRGGGAVAKMLRSHWSPGVCAFEDCVCFAK